MIFRQFLLLIVLGVATNSVKALPQRRFCLELNSKSIFIADNSQDKSDEYEGNNIDDEEDVNEVELTNYTTAGVEQCQRDQPFCYTLWRTDKNGTNLIMKQGCWDSSDSKATCNQKMCAGELSTGSLFFCCCSGDLCNSNLTNPERIVAPPESVISSGNIPKFEEKYVLQSPMVWISFFMVIGVLAALIGLATCHSKPKAEPESAPLAPSGPGYSSNSYNVDNLKLVSMIGRGKYGTVWKAVVNEQSVAVKIFSEKQRHYFINEKSIYSEPLMESPALLAYFGCDERRTLDDHAEYLLVLSLAPLGCLQDWLIDNTTSFSGFCKMAKSVARGLSHLHTEIRKGDLTKFCIVHRDINSRNILVKPDLSCCLCDLGFAMKTSGSRYEYRGEMILAETKSINEVGTLRYMSPEILEGAVNLRDCETSLKQIDVYSLGLVIWELCMRCNDFYPAEQGAPLYSAPYEAEIGKNPSFEQMQVLVSRHKARPLFPSSWGGGPAAKVAKDTCEDCWDHDAEARLTSLCVEERLHEISSLKPRAGPSRGASPPLNTNNFIPSTPPAIVNFNSLKDCNASYATMILPPNQNLPIHDENTTDTYLSPSTPNGAVSKVPIKNFDMFSQQIHPFQGKNPCMERNLIQQANLSSSDKSCKKSHPNGNVNINNNDLFYNIEDEVLVEEFLEQNIPSTAILSQTNILMGEGIPKQNNTDKKQNKWVGVKDMIQRKFFKKNQPDEARPRNGSDNFKLPTNRNIHLNLIESHQNSVHIPPKRMNGDIVQNRNIIRPSNLDISPIVVSRSYKRPPNDNTDQIFAVINSSPRIVASKSANAVGTNDSCHSLLEDSPEKQFKRQRSLEVFRDVFGPKGSIERLRDVSQRIKTPGDVPPSVRKVRASKTLSLYDDRMMDSTLFSLRDQNSV